LGSVAQVITSPDNLTLRESPRQDAGSLADLINRTKVNVIGGPVCNVYHPDKDMSRNVFSWWWKVRVEGTETEGWIVEGSDSQDEIFVLPTNLKDGTALLYIPPGTFEMGLRREDMEPLLDLCSTLDCKALYDAVPAHEEEISNGYFIYRTEVSIEQYMACSIAGPCTAPQELFAGSGSSFQADYYSPTFAQFPVVWMTWDQASTYCDWAGGRLPTSAEWEYAARGTEGYLFPWGVEPPNGTQANVYLPPDNLTNIKFNPSGIAKPVDSYADFASPFGVLNMSGNVWEWVADSADSDPNQKVGRGGSWWIRSALSSPVIEDLDFPTETGSAVGFRCVIDP
jgi:formylglycine-generating enzyme required for sulfatase activity